MVSRPRMVLASIVTAVCALGPVVLDQSPTRAAPAPDVTRVGGANRTLTAIEVSKVAFSSAATVVIARQDDYADALAGTPLAAKLDAPVLLTSTGSLAPEVLTEITRLGATTAILLGGEAALSAQVAAQLTTAGLTVDRVAGATRFETAAAVAGRVGPSTTVFLVEGQNADPARGWPDAVAVGPLAAHLGAPILPVTKTSVPASITSALTGATSIWIVGGTAAIGNEVVTAVSGTGRTVRRVAGQSRYGTSSALFDWMVDAGLDGDDVWLASGANYPDALAAGAAIAHLGDTLLLVDPVALGNSPDTRDRIADPTTGPDDVRVLGLQAAVGNQVITDIAAVRDSVDGAYCLTILHNNDGESRLLPDAGGFGGAARFVGLMATLRNNAISGQGSHECGARGLLAVTSGDNFLAGINLNASFEKGVPWYDSVTLNSVGYDALILGNHDFDFGPDSLADFISGFDADTKFVSANINVSAEPSLDALADAGRIVPSILVSTGGRTIGVLGLVTDRLPTISSPRGVVVDPNLAAVLASQVSSLRSQGADIVVLVSHLQDINEDLALLANSAGVDLAIGGGGDEVLGSPSDDFYAGDDQIVASTYPIYAAATDGTRVPVVTTAGNYRYIGRFQTRFDANDDLVSVDTASAMQLVGPSVVPDPTILATVEAPLAAYVAAADANVIATSQVALNGTRPPVRQQETNMGNLMADALLWQAQQLAASFGVPAPQVALQNGGGIRNIEIIPAGDVTEKDTFDTAAFANFVSVHPNVSAATLKNVLEQAYRSLPSQAGNFAQIAGMKVQLDSSRPVGSKVRHLELDNGTVLVDDGVVVGGAPSVTVATIDFLSRGGDGYPLAATPFTVLGVTYQQALEHFIVTGLAGSITAADYPEAGEGRITFVNP